MKLKESETVELKKSTLGLKEAVVSIAAMLNKHGKGTLFFGIRNDGFPTGQIITENTLREISRMVSDSIEPKIYPKIKEFDVAGKKCAQIEFSGHDAPYFARGRPYIRVGDENRLLSARELERMILEKNQETSKWDSKPCEEASIKGISAKKLKAFLKKAGLEYTSIKNGLHSLELLKNGKPLNAAVIFFASAPEKFFRNAKLRCAYFPTENTTTILDRQEHEGDLLYLIEKAEEYILKNIHIGMKLKGLYRMDVPEIDREAFREAIINAFCHRDYYDEDSVDIAVFKNRLEIRSPGLLYGGLTIPQIKKGMVSARRNKRIADLFHRIHYVEKWGRGIRLILSKEPKTRIEEIGTHFMVVFKRKTASERTPQSALPEPRKTVEKTVEKILAILRENPEITQQELAEKTKLTRRGIEWNLQQLKKKGLLKRVGPDKGGHWEVKK